MEDDAPMKWFRMYHDLVDDPKVQRLPGETFKFWINVLCLASQSEVRGLIDLDIWEISWRSRITEQEVRRHLNRLIEAGLVHQDDNGDVMWVHNWQGRQEDET